MSTNPTNSPDPDLYRHRLRALADHDQMLAEAMMLRNIALLNQQWEVEDDAVRIAVMLRARLRELEGAVRAYHKKRK